MAVVGGVGELKEPNEAVVEILATIRPQLEDKLGKTFEEYTPVHHKTQLVNGVNYFIKIRVGSDNDHIHVRVHKAFNGDITLHSIQENKTAQEEVDYF